MVHGINCEIAYEIDLLEGQSVDFFDDLLPIWMATRTRVEMKPTNHSSKRQKLVVLNNLPKSEELLHSEHYKGWQRSVYSSEPISIYDCIRDLSKYLDAYKYKLLQFYNLEIKSRPLLPTSTMVSDELVQLKCDADRIYDQSTLAQHVLSNQQVLTAIKEVDESILSHVHLSEAQQQVIQTVVNHPNLAGKIQWHGLRCLEVHW